MEKRIGTFYGVSVGPGDPELMTLQAVRRLENCPVIAAPQTPKGGMLALDIAKGAVDLSGKTILPLRFAMSLDPAVQKAAHIEAARAVKEYLDAGQDVAMLNLGDLSVRAAKAVFVQDMGKAKWEQPVGHWIDAKTAIYVLGSKRHGSMGPTIASFAQEADAVKFAAEYGGKVLRFGEITADMVDLSGAALHDTRM